jgi:hypothetical protein
MHLFAIMNETNGESVFTIDIMDAWYIVALNMVYDESDMTLIEMLESSITIREVEMCEQF